MSKVEGDLRRFEHPDNFGTWLGYKVTSFDRKLQKAELELQIRSDHLSPSGRVHGGVVSAFFDYACGAAAFTTMEPGDYCSTIELKVNYMKPVEDNDRLVAKTQVVFRGNRLCVLQGFIYRNDEEKPVAMASATFNVVTKKK